MIATTGNRTADERIKQYHDELLDLTTRAVNGDIDQNTFVEEMTRLVSAVIALLFVLGGGDLTSPTATAEIDELRSQQIASIEVLAADIYSGRYNTRSAEEATRGLPKQTEEEGIAKLGSRLILWTFAASRLFTVGQKHAAPSLDAETGLIQEPRYRWEYGDTDHCPDCQNLNGVVLTASEWRQIGIEPKSPNLECGGRRCQCRFVPTDEPSIGLSRVPL